MKFERLLNLKVEELFNENQEIEKVSSGYEFLGTLWSGYVYGFTCILKKRLKKCICINIEDLNEVIKKNICNTILVDNFDLLTKTNIINSLGQSDIVAMDLNTIEYISNNYYISFTFDDTDKLTYIEVTDFIPKFDIQTKNELINSNEFNNLLKKRKKQGGLIHHIDFVNLKHEDFFEHSTTETNFSYMKKRWFAKRYRCSDFYYDKKNNSVLKMKSVGFRDFKKNKLKAFNTIIGLQLSFGMSKAQLEDIISQKPIFSQEYGPSMIYDYILKSNNNEDYLLQVMIDIESKVGLHNVMLTPNTKLQGYNWSPI